MRTRWMILLYAAFVALPTLVGGVLALRLLGREEARLRSESRAAVEDRARLAAENVAAAVAEVQGGLMASLQALDPATRADQLRELRAANPLVRNVFIWTRGAGLALPDPGGLLADEERGFVERYALLWSGRQAWPAAPPRDDPAASSSRAVLRQAAQVRSKISWKQSYEANEYESAATSSGWLPWFDGGQLFLLGWVQAPEGATYGLELELAAVQARLQDALPAPRDGDAAVALSDGEGRVIVQRGALDTSGGVKPALAVPVGAVLPHWQIAVYGVGASPAAAGRGFRVLATVMVCGLGVAVLVGGVLLLREARRQGLDAQRKTSFVSNVSHELRTPLTTIRMYAELMAEGRVADPAKQRGYLETIVRESQRLTRLVNNVLDFSRLEMNRKKYQVENLPAAAWLEELVDQQRVRAEEAGVRLAFAPVGELGTVRADRDAADQVVLNLLDNALKYAAAGGEVTVEAERAGARLAVRVLDRGPGVPARLGERVFEKFFRADDSLTAHVPGSGLGLSIARRLARDLGGDLVCRARAGGGACFEFTLPTGTNPERGPVET